MAAVSAQPAPAATPTPVNLLVVDDRKENRAALRAILAGSEYSIVEADSGPAALRQLLEHEFAVLLIDIMMPGMDGYELASLIRTRERTATVPIVFVTGAATDTQMIFKGYRVGAVDYIVKPLDAEILRAKVSVFAELYRQRKRSEASAREKDLLLRELHHRVKNNLQVITSLLHLQGSTQPPAVAALFADTEARVRSIALVHTNLYKSETLATIDVQSYFESLVASLLETYGAHVETHVDGGGQKIQPDVAVTVGLIVNELLSNSLKYAFPLDRHGSVNVTCREEDRDRLLVEVQDDGVGIPASIDVHATSTMGLQLVRTLVGQISGTLEHVRGNGTTIRVHFPRAG